jgi:hypothetical protein
MSQMKRYDADLEDELLLQAITVEPDGSYLARFRFDDIELKSNFKTRAQAVAWYYELDEHFYP